MFRNIIFIFLMFVSTVYAEALPIHLLKLPSGFSIEIYAASVPDARSMALGSNNIVFVGTRKEGKVYAIVPDKQHYAKTKVITIASGLTMPNGIVFYKGDLYVAEMSRVLRFKNIEANLAHPSKPEVITDSLPGEKHHGWRYMRVGPDGKLYIGIGAPCNHCISEDPRFASIIRMNTDGSNQEIYARGVRNTVGFGWDPATHDLWFTDNGTDWMGDNLPPDEVNHAVKKGLHFGYPYCHGKNISDPEFGKRFPCSAFQPPQVELTAHAASLGMLFYTGNMFPKSYSHRIFIAQHGSWNRTTKVGYDVIVVNPVTKRVEPFITGWLHDGEVWGRPVDLLQLKDGTLLISDDYAGVIYRVSYKKNH